MADIKIRNQVIPNSRRGSMHNSRTLTGIMSNSLDTSAFWNILFFMNLFVAGLLSWIWRITCRMTSNQGRHGLADEITEEEQKVQGAVFSVACTELFLWKWKVPDYSRPRHVMTSPSCGEVMHLLSAGLQHSESWPSPWARGAPARW